MFMRRMTGTFRVEATSRIGRLKSSSRRRSSLRVERPPCPANSGQYPACAPQRSGALRSANPPMIDLFDEFRDILVELHNAGAIALGGNAVWTRDIIRL
jgi:hypothetical protein